MVLLSSSRGCHPVAIRRTRAGPGVSALPLPARGSELSTVHEALLYFAEALPAPHLGPAQLET